MNVKAFLQSESLLPDETKKASAQMNRGEKIAYIMEKYFVMSAKERAELEHYADYLLSKRSK